MQEIGTGLNTMVILIEEVFGQEVRGLLQEHLQELSTESPPESMHALPLGDLKHSDITFWCAWQKPSLNNELIATTGGSDSSAVSKGLMGFVALKQLTQQHAELKSMRTSRMHKRKGVASALLEEVMRVALLRGYQRVSLETGTMSSFQPAIALYKRFGFDFCEPFADYREDPNSCYMSRLLN